MANDDPVERPDSPTAPETTAAFVGWMPNEPSKVPEVPIPEGWNRPQPTTLPRPTFWPAVLAFGVMLIVWGPVSTFIITGVGVLLCIFALRGWIRELLDEDEG